MRNLIVSLAALAFFAASHAEARPPERIPAGTNAVIAAKRLLAKLKAHPPKAKLHRLHALDTPLLAFLPSPSLILQGQSLTVIIESADNFTGGTLLSLDYSLNGGAVQSAPMIDNNGMFAAVLGAQTLAGSNALNASLYIESTANNTDLRTSIKNLNTSIGKLTTQINADRDPVDRANLEEQRGEQLALVNELTAELRTYRTLVGTQAFAYTVSSNSSSPNAPQVTAISPSSGDVRGGTKVTFTGANFSPAFTVSFGGVASPSVTFVNSTTVTAYTPDLGLATGIKDVELRFNVSGVITNVLIPGGYFATNVVPVAPTKPVAVASGSQNIRLGDTASLDGTQSYDNRVTTFDYAWKVVNAPANSNFAAGQTVGTASTLSVTPNALGAYVFSLVVTEHDTAEHLVSDASIAEVVVGSSPAPVAPAIILQRGATATSQVIANDPEVGSAEVYSISQAPLHGTASVDTNGLATYVAGSSFAGSDPFTVLVTNQAGLSGSVSIPVTVVTYSHAPAPTAPGISTHSEPGFSQVSPNDPDPGMTYSYSIVVPPSHGTASVNASGLVSYASSGGYVGSDSLIVEVMNSEAAPESGLANVNITVAPNSTPQVSAQNIATIAGQSATSQASVVDDAGQTGTWSVSAPANGAATISASGLVTYTPNSGFGGTDSITVSYTDNGNPALTGSATISAGVVGPPTATAPGITVADGGSSTSQISVSSVSEGRTYSFAITTPPANGTASVSGTGLVAYAPTAPFTGSDTVVVKVVDTGNSALFTSVTIPVSVTANHAPTGSAPSITVAARGTATTQVTPSDQDPGQTFSYSIAQPPSLGSASVSGTGLVSYTSNVGYANSDSIVVQVTDNGTPALSGTFSIPVSVTGPANNPPVIPNPLFYRLLTNGVPYQVGLSISSAATPSGGITAANGIKSISWDFGDGTHETITDAAQALNNHNYVATGTYTATLKVTDTLDAVSTETLSVNVVNQPIPVAKFTISPATGNTLNTPITFNASNSSDPNGITQYRWLFCGQTAEVVTTSPSIQRTFTTAGTCSVRLRVRNSFIGEGQATVSFGVGGSVASGPSPMAKPLVGPPREVVLGTAHAFSGAGSFNANVGGTIATYNWNFVDSVNCPGGVGTNCTASGVSASHSYTYPTNYFPSLQVVSGAGSTSPSANQEVFSVNSSGHAPHALLVASALSGVAPFSVTLDGTGSYAYPPANLQTYGWSFGDGTSGASTSSTTHTFSAAGVYIVNLTVTDSNGNNHAVNQAITVTASRNQLAGHRDAPNDPDREYQRQVLAGACVNGEAEACSELGDMYAEDGDAYTAAQLKAKACSMGYQDACSK